MPQNLQCITKIKRLEKQILFNPNDDLACFESKLFEPPKFSDFQKYLRSIKKYPEIAPTVKIDATEASIDKEKAVPFNT